MTPEYAISFFQEALAVAGTLALPSLLLGLAVGLVVSIFQAVTQINEQTLTFIPKILAIVGALIFFGHWMLQRLLVFTESVFTRLGNLPG